MTSGVPHGGLMDRILWNTGQFPDRREITRSYGSVMDVPTTWISMFPTGTVVQDMDPLYASDGPAIGTTGQNTGCGQLYPAGRIRRRF